MRVVVQRVKHASLTADGVPFSQIGKGLLVMVGIMRDDTLDIVKRSAKKLSTMRIFERAGKLNDSVLDLGAEILLVSNFTLCTAQSSGARPDFSLSADKVKASDLYMRLSDELRSLGVPTSTGVFGADMQIDTTLDGPITIFKEF